MGLDLRLPIGTLFIVIGLLLVGYGFLNTGVDVDRWWGLVMLLFGTLMAWLARRARKA